MDARYGSSIMMVDKGNNIFTPLLKWSEQNMCFCITQSISSLEMYDKIIPNINNIYKMVNEMSNTRGHRLCSEKTEESREIIGSSSKPTFLGEDDVCGSHISILDLNNVKSRGWPRVNTKI